MASPKTRVVTESIVTPLAMTNLLQDNVHKREDDMEENEELTTTTTQTLLETGVFDFPRRAKPSAAA